ncbi:MAG TPA: aminopeptidase P N-terminal domain-containing protein [Candidatus Kapabacteria bacterium]|jgi:Xaa-Pro aminopeptidase
MPQLDPKILEQRRKRTLDAWNLTNDSVLIGGGLPISIPGGADQTFPFHTHPEYYWLTGRQREGGVLAYDSREGWTLFEPPLSQGEQVWGGSEAPIGRPIEELESWTMARQGRRIRWLGVTKYAEADQELRDKYLHVRRNKDEAELYEMKRAVSATAAGHAIAKEMMRSGKTERQVQIEIEAAFFRAGADTIGYGTIVGSGPNATLLHSTPGSKKLKSGEFVVVDAGAMVNGYTADVTRTPVVDDVWHDGMREIYDAVLTTQERTIAACVIGAEWGNVHILAARTLAEALKAMHVINTSVDEAIESELIALFLPHGIGHMVGLGVRDASGPYPGRDGKNKFAGVKIRMDLPLGENYLVTVEPGLYFNKALLTNTENREKYKSAVNWEKIEPWIGSVGVRIEDNILVTASGPINLTSEIPK